MSAAAALRVTEQAEAQVHDRQQALRDEVERLEQQLEAAEASTQRAVEAKAAAKTVADRTRVAFKTADGKHRAAAEALAAALQERNRLDEGVAGLRRRLEMAEAVRGARA